MALRLSRDTAAAVARDQQRIFEVSLVREVIAAESDRLSWTVCEAVGD